MDSLPFLSSCVKQQFLQVVGSGSSLIFEMPQCLYGQYIQYSMRTVVTAKYTGTVQTVIYVPYNTILDINYLNMVKGLKHSVYFSFVFPHCN